MRLRAEQIETRGQGTGHCFGIEVVMSLFASNAKEQKGFTLVELIAVLVIVGILAVAAVPRFFDSNVFQARGAADQVTAALRYGQKVAIAQRGLVSVNITTANSSNCGAALSGGNVNCVISNSVPAPGLPKTVTFNALGQTSTKLADSITVGTTIINIEAETGYVH